MIGRTWDRACLGASLVLLAVLLAGGCRPPAAEVPRRDELEELAELVALGRTLQPLALEACALLPPQGRHVCEGLVDGADDVLAIAGPVTEQVALCREAADEACLEAGRETARTLLPELRRLLRIVQGVADAR